MTHADPEIGLARRWLCGGDSCRVWQTTESGCVRGATSVAQLRRAGLLTPSASDHAEPGSCYKTLMRTQCSWPLPLIRSGGELYTSVMESVYSVCNTLL